MRLYYAVVYYVSWLVFGVVGFALNILSLVALALPCRQKLEPVARKAIRLTCDFWFKGMHAAGILRVSWKGFDRPMAPGTVIVANHPTLIDAILIMARVDDLICIFKPKLMHNPAIGPAALLAGYVAADGGVSLIRQAAAAVRAGRSLLIFPEGTRTAPGTVLGPLRSGFALIARQAGARIVYVRVRATPGLTARGRPWWRLPATLPLVAQVEVDRCWEAAEQGGTVEMTEALRAHMLMSLTQ